MLKRIQTIKGIGRFESVVVPGLAFQKETIVFGKNAKGKSTLTAILRSLSENRPRMLVGRKTFGFGGSQKVEIDFEVGGNVSKSIFDARTWTISRPEILIFDPRYVRDNITDGFVVNHQHKSNLRMLIIGDVGKEILQKLGIILEKLRLAESRKSAIQESFKSQILPNYPDSTLESFCSLPPSQEGPELDSLERKLNETKNSVQIANLIGSTDNPFKRLLSMIEKLKPTMLESIEFDSVIIEQHIKASWQNPSHSHSFLAEGMRLTKFDMAACVFCGQNLGAEQKNLLNAYQRAFSDSYKDLQQNIQQSGNEFLRYDFSTRLTAYLDRLKAYSYELELTQKEIDQFAVLKETIDQKVEAKQKDLSLVIDLLRESHLTESADLLQKIIQTLELKRQELTASDTSAQIDSIKSQMTTLKLMELSQADEWRKRCTEYSAANSEVVQLKREREKLNNELLTQQQSVFTDHEVSINEYLEQLNAHFRIAGFRPEKDQRRTPATHFCVFQVIFFNGHKVELHTTQDEEATFENSLSESDKRLLAFAFFMSTLKHDGQLSEKIVILDDPMSSLDRERKRATAILISSLIDFSHPPQQLIILSHEEAFVRELLDKSQLAGAATLKITDDNTIVNRSNIEQLSVDIDMPRDETIAIIDSLYALLRSSNIPQGFQNKCRSVLDEILMRKYRPILVELPPRSGTRKYIETLSIKGVNGFGGIAASDGRLILDSETPKTVKFLNMANELNQDSHTASTDNSSGDDKNLLVQFFQLLEEV